jgi:OFA family oxalate/formate antiporter-like MFS transporter
MDEHRTDRGSAIRSERFFYGWFIVGILFVISLIDGGFTYTFSTFLKPLTEDFGWSRAETATAFSLYLLIGGLVLPVWGWLVDHIGARWVFLLSSLIDGVALLCLSTVQNLSSYYGWYLLLGVGLAGIGPMPVGKLITQWFVAKRGRAMGLALVGASGGGLVLVPLCGFLIAEFSWRIAYQALAALSLGLMLPLVWFFVVNRPEEKGLLPLGPSERARQVERDDAGGCAERGAETAPKDALEARDWTLTEALSTLTFWLLGVTFCLGLMAAGAVHTHQVAFLQDVGQSLELAATITGVSLGMSMAGRFAAGWISEHFPRPHYILAICLLMQAAGTGFLMSLDIFGLWGLALFVPLFGLGYGGMIVLWPLTVSHDFGRQAFGAIAGVLGTLGLSLGGAAGPIIAGAIFDGTGSYDWAFGGCMSLFLVGACAAGAAPELGTVRPVLTTDAVAEEQRSL